MDYQMDYQGAAALIESEMEERVLELYSIGVPKKEAEDILRKSIHFLRVQEQYTLNELQTLLPIKEKHFENSSKFSC